MSRVEDSDECYTSLSSGLRMSSSSTAIETLSSASIASHKTTKGVAIKSRVPESFVCYCLVQSK